MSEHLQADGQELLLFRDECLGSGAYGMVCKAKLGELPCAAKLLHRALFHPTIQRRFEQECQLLQNMRHPNVVQYLSIAHEPRSHLPILLMELLDGNLTDFLERSDEALPYHLQVNLWYDIALALTYLHSKHIIHRDLSGNNVLLIAGSRAKVTDFGMSMLTGMDVTKSRLTHCPDNANYMSPEALIEPPVYSEKLDVFSSGVVAIQIITHKFPEPAPSMICRDDPRSRTGFSLTPVPEIERRENHINLIEPKHPMLPVIQSCLRDRERERPSAQQLCHQLVTLKQAREYAQSKQQPTPKERRIQEQEQLIQEQHQAVQQMQNEITKWEEQVQVLNARVLEQSQELQLKKQELSKTQSDLQQKTEELQQKTEELHQQSLEQQRTLQEQVLQKFQQQSLEQQRPLQEQVLEKFHQQSLEQQRALQKQLLQDFHQESLEQQRVLQEQVLQKFQQQNQELQQALQGQALQDLQLKIEELESKVKENHDNKSLIEKLPPAFVVRLTAEELPHQMKKHIEEGLQEWERNLCKLRLFCRHPHTGEMMERKLEIHKDKSFRDAVKEAHKLLDLERYAPLEQCRLVRYDYYSEVLDQSFEGQEDMPLDQLMVEDKHTKVVCGPQSYELFMEIRAEGEVFKVYKTGGLNLKVIVIDVGRREACGPVFIRGEQGWRVADLKTEITERLNLSAHTMRVALETYQSAGKHLADPQALLKDESFYRKHTVFVCCDAEDSKKNFYDSEMNQLIDQYINSILLNVTIPPPPRGKTRVADEVKKRQLGVEGSQSVTEERPRQRNIQVRIDRRSTLADLKELLEKLVQRSSSNFKIYRVYSNNQEYEIFRLTDTLMTVQNETRMIVRLGRALKPGEFRIRLFLLRMREVEFCKPLMDSIVAKGMTVLEFKERIVKEAYDQGIEHPLRADRIRLRKKTWQTAGTIYLNHQVFEKDIHVFAHFEMYVEPLEDADQMIYPTQMQVYLRRWRPSLFIVDPIQEIIMDGNGLDHLRKKISEVSNIPVERVEFAKSYGSFPSEMSVLEVEDELEWNPSIPAVASMPLSIYDDGAILYYKDSAEQLADLSPERRNELQKQENTRLSKFKPSIAQS